MMYKLTNGNVVIHLEKNAWIVMEETNRHYQDYLTWVAAGNEPLPADPEPLPGNSETSLNDVKQWLIDNPGAKQIWELSLEDLEAQMIQQIDDLYPTATAQAKNKERLLRMTIALLIRREAKQLGLVD